MAIARQTSQFLFVAQGDDWVDLRGASRWEITGCQGDQQQKKRDTRECERIRFLHTVKQTPYEACESQGPGNADKNSGNNQGDSLAKHRVWSVLNPGSTPRSRKKLFKSKPAPIRSITASAISDTTSRLRRRRPV